MKAVELTKIRSLEILLQDANERGAIELAIMYDYLLVRLRRRLRRAK